MFRNSLIIRRLEEGDAPAELIEAMKLTAAEDDDVLFNLINTARLIRREEYPCSNEVEKLIHEIIRDTGGSFIAALLESIFVNAFP